MTQITMPLELLLTGIAGLLALGVGGTWKIVSAINAGREALKGELKADVVHKRIGDHGKRVSLPHNSYPI